MNGDITGKARADGKLVYKNLKVIARDHTGVHAPKQRAKLPFNAAYTAEQYTRLRQGRIPAEMENKRFIYLDGGVLRFHRS